MSHESAPPPMNTGLHKRSLQFDAPLLQRQQIGQMRNLLGEVLTPLTAPRSGWILFRDTHLFAPKGRLIFGVGDGPETPETN